MPIWMVDWFGGRQLDAAFGYLLFMTAPVWIGMIALPRNRVVAVIAQPFVAPLLFLPVLFYILWQARSVGFLPAWIETADYRSARSLARHPVAFLAIFCQLQILHLFVGTVIYQKARSLRMNVPVELFVAWFLGLLALLPFSIRLLLGYVGVSKR
jgi:hypothetical protein